MQPRTPRTKREAPPGPVVLRTLELERFRVSECWFPPHLELPKHEHDRSVFAIFADGSMDIDFARAHYECVPGTVQVHPAGEPHAQRFPPSGARALVVDADAEAIDHVTVTRLLSTVHSFRHVGIAQLASQATHELTSADPVAPLATEALVLEMLALASRARNDEHLMRKPPAWLARAEDLLRSRFREPVRIKDIAAEIGVHPFHLSRTFHRHFQVPLGHYVRTLRLEWCARKLRETREPIAQIAMHAGFTDQSHLTRVFKQHVGMTPARYRESACETPQPTAPRPTSRG